MAWRLSASELRLQFAMPLPLGEAIGPSIGVTLKVMMGIGIDQIDDLSTPRLESRSLLATRST